MMSAMAIFRQSIFPPAAIQHIAPSPRIHRCKTERCTNVSPVGLLKHCYLEVQDLIYPRYLRVNWMKRIEITLSRYYLRDLYLPIYLTFL